MRGHFLQPWTLLGAAALAVGCAKNVPTAPEGALTADKVESRPDLSLQQVAFARMVDGRVVARGTADQLDYRRSGGVLNGRNGTAALHPEPGTGLATFGELRLSAPQVEGEVGARRGTANGGVVADAQRGDHAVTALVEYDGAAGTVRAPLPVDAVGPGYTVHGSQLVGRTDGSEVRLLHGTRGQLTVEGGR